MGSSSAHRPSITRARWEAALNKSGEDYELPCAVNEDFSGVLEAVVFLGVNRDRAAVGNWDEYAVGLRGGHEPYVGIEAVLKQRGLGAAQKASPNRIGAVRALLWVSKSWGTAMLGTTVDVLEVAFTRQASTWDADMIQAAARLLGTQPGPRPGASDPVAPEALGRPVARRRHGASGWIGEPFHRHGEGDRGGLQLPAQPGRSDCSHAVASRAN